MAIAVERELLPRRQVLRENLISRTRFFQLLLAVVFFGTWEIVGRQVGDFFLAPPSQVIDATVEVVENGQLLAAVLDSALSLVVGFALAIIVGVGVGVLMGWHKGIAEVLNPFVSAGYVIPVAAVVPLLIIWFGLGFAPRVAAVALFAVFEILVSTYTGVKNVDRNLVQVARSFGASWGQLFSKVVFFAALPYIFAGLRMGAARAIKGMVIAELLFAVTGIGGELQRAANDYRTDLIFVYVLALAVMGIALSAVVQGIERWWMRSWNDGAGPST